MELNGLGEIVGECWNKIPEHFPNVELDIFVTMPNHLHGIIVLTGDQTLYTRRGTACRAPTIESFGKPVAKSLPTVMRSFKSGASKQINKARKTPGCPLWQRNYYEHVVRNEEDLNEIREYIITNPLKWAVDRENPNNCL
jgi:REP element-mobilizing transposase RayT